MAEVRDAGVQAAPAVVVLAKIATVAGIATTVRPGHPPDAHGPPPPAASVPVELSPGRGAVHPLLEGAAELARDSALLPSAPPAARVDDDRPPPAAEAGRGVRGEVDE